MALRAVFAPIAWVFRRLWWLLDVTRRTLLNLLLLVLIVAVLWSAFGPGSRTPLRDNNTLVLALRGDVVEQYSGSPREQLMAEARGQGSQQTRLRDVLAALDAASKDGRIAQILLDTQDMGSAGLASLREIAAALERAKAAGKRVVAYGDSYDQRGYFLAAHASEVYLHPMGMVGLEGFGRYRSYYKDAFERLGVSANVLRVGRYKNAAEPFFASGPSEATREADKALYGDLWAQYTGAIEKARKLPAGHIHQGIEQLPERVAQVKGDFATLALQSKLIDGIKTRDEVRQLLIQRGAADDKGSYRRVMLAEYLKQQPADSPIGAGVGIVVAEGEIVDGKASAGRIGGDSTALLIRQARENKDVKAVVLRVNSPGGSAFASEIVRRELELTRAAGKPVVVSMGNVAASGGYWIAMSADRVVADPATITGSIGVFGMLPTGDKLMDKLSIHTDGTTTTWLAGAYDPRRPLDPRFAALVQSGIDRIYADFTQKAAAARKKSVEQIDAVAQGRVWTGQQALQHGLIDALGSLDDAVTAAAKLGKLDTATPRRLYIEKEPTAFERFLAGLAQDNASIMAAPLRQALGLPDPALTQWAAPMQADLAFVADLAQRRVPYSAVVHCFCEIR